LIADPPLSVAGTQTLRDRDRRWDWRVALGHRTEAAGNHESRWPNGTAIAVGESPSCEPWSGPMTAGESEPEPIAMPPCESEARVGVGGGGRARADWAWFAGGGGRRPPPCRGPPRQPPP